MLLSNLIATPQTKQPKTFVLVFSEHSQQYFLIVQVNYSPQMKVGRIHSYLSRKRTVPLTKPNQGIVFHRIIVGTIILVLQEEKNYSCYF